MAKLTDEDIMILLETMADVSEKQDTQISGLIDVVKLLNEELTALRQRVTNGGL